MWVYWIVYSLQYTLNKNTVRIGKIYSYIVYIAVLPWEGNFHSHSHPIPTGSLWESSWGSTCGSPYGNPHMDIHMGIPTGENHIPILNPVSWEWGSIWGYQYGYPHMDIHMGISIWRSIWGFPYPRQPWTILTIFLYGVWFECYSWNGGWLGLEK